MELPIIFVQTFVFIISLYPFVNLSIEWHQFWLYSFFTAFVCSGFTYMASTSLTSTRAQLAVVVNVMVAVLFSGIAIKLSTLNSHFVSRALSYMSFVRWFAELVYIREVYNKSIAWRMPPAFYKQKSQYSALRGVFTYSYTPRSDVFGLNLFILCFAGLIFRMFAYWCLVLLSREWTAPGPKPEPGHSSTIFWSGSGQVRSPPLFLLPQVRIGSGLCLNLL